MNQMADELTVDTVREFIALNDGKVKNTVLVAHFKKILNNPSMKVEARQKFKNCVNDVAVVKTENGEKYVQLKKKFRTAMPVSSSSLSSFIPESHSTQASPSHISSFDNPILAEPENPILYADNTEGFDIHTEERKHSNASSKNGRSTDPDAEDNMFKQLSDNSGLAPMEIEHKPIPESSKKSYSHHHGEKKIAVPSNEREVEQNRENVPPSNSIVPIGAVERARQNLQNKNGDSDDTSSISHSEHQSESIKDSEQEFYDKGIGQFTDPLEKLWVLSCARGNMVDLRKLLNQDPNLAEKRDFMLGYTALHWAAKKGNIDLIKMFGDAGVEVNTKSKGGYTPVHLAAMNGHKKALQVLVDEYDADPNIRDHSGKLPRYYLETQSFSLPLQKILLGNDGHSSLKDFTHGLRPRLDSVRKSKRLGDAISGGVGVFGSLVKGRATSTEELSNTGSPTIGRKGSIKGKSKKKSRKWGSREEKSNLMVKNDDVDSGFSVSGTSSMSSAQDLRHSHLSHGDQRSRGGSTNSRYQDYNESE